MNNTIKPLRLGRAYSKLAVPTSQVLDHVLERDEGRFRQHIAAVIFETSKKIRETDIDWIVEVDVIVATPEQFRQLVAGEVQRALDERRNFVDCYVPDKKELAL